MTRISYSLRILRLTQALASGLILLLVVLFILPSYTVTADPSSLSVVQSNDSTEAGVSGFNINYVDDHGDDYDPDMEEFVATNEWQQVKHGQAVPRGLHIRMNLQTGIKEAKLLDPEDSKSSEKSASITPDANDKDSTSDDMARMVRMKENLEKAMKDLEAQQESGENLAYWKDGEKEGMMNMGKDTFTKEELKEALKRFKANRDDVQNPDKVKYKYRSMDELKKDMDALNMGMKTDVEIIRELVDLYRNETISEEQRLNILTDLEYYVHQIDNALDLVDMGGMSLVLKDLNHTSEEIRSEAAFVIGSAAQSNPKVQIFMLDNGIMPTLIRMLSTQSSPALRNRILYALSSLLRHFPYAQLHFLQQGGLQALSTVFQTGGTEKLQLKAVTLINDLVIEKKEILKKGANHKYDETHLKDDYNEMVRLANNMSSILRDVIQFAKTSVLKPAGSIKVDKELIEKSENILEAIPKMFQNLAHVHLREQDSHEKEKMKQYKQILLLESLKEHGWCNLVPTLLDVSEHDAREKVIVTMATLAEECKWTFISSMEKLLQLETEYKVLSQDELKENDDDLYFTGILQILEKLIREVGTVRDEL